MSLGIALLFVGMFFIMLTLYFQKRRMDATDKINSIYLESIQSTHDKLWKDNDSLWAEVAELKKLPTTKRPKG